MLLYVKGKSKNMLEQFLKNNNHWLDGIGLLLDIVGFSVMIFTAFKVYFLDKRMLLFNQKYLFHSRSTDYITSLNEIAIKILSFITHFEEKKREIMEQIKISEEIAKNIQKKLPQNPECKNLITKAQKIVKPTEFTEDIAYNYCSELRGFIVHLEQLKKDNENSLPL